MPNIDPGFTAPNLALTPSETGVEATARAGVRLGAYGNQIAGSYERLGQESSQAIRNVGDAAVDYMDHQQINAGADHGASLFANLTDAWNKTAANADPHDPTVAQKFREETLKPALDQFTQGFTTEKSQEWANHFANNLRQHMFEKTEADMSSLAKDAVATTVQNLGNKLSNTAVSDPSSVDASLSMVDHSIDGILGANPNIKGADAGRVRLEVGEKIKGQVVNAGAFGAIQKAGDPEAVAAQWATKYPDYINGAEEMQLAKAAKTQSRANALIEKQSTIADRQLAELQVHQGATKAITDNVSFDPQTGQPVIDPKFYKDALDIAHKNPNAPNAAETVRTMFNWGETQQNKGAKPTDDPTALTDLTDRMFSPTNPTTLLDLMKAHDAKKISDETFKLKSDLVKELSEAPLKDPVFKDTVDAVKDDLILSNVGLPGKDITGASNYAKWAQGFIPQYLSMSRAGTLPPNALDVKDPKSLISQSMAPFKRTVAQRVQDYMSVLGAGNSPAAPQAVTDQKQYDALKSGDVYISTDGAPHRKP